MGQTEFGNPEDNQPCLLTRVSINQGGYDRLGNYWGTGQKLFKLESETCRRFVRAYNRLHAYEKFKEQYPNLKLYRGFRDN